VLALVGANGAGKTTLLRSIAGAHLPSSGRVLLNDEDLAAVPSHKRIAKGIALVPEGRSSFREAGFPPPSSAKTDAGLP
ncbi:ATP-binding cassette domain-containing protein, partial [Rhizobium leguminosarum]|uniref:ATP-binding cassette domain-containing protein n=1 Tax=Rhizobium leguminosarum TaxID=384 RepID=UPI003F9B1B3B